MHLVFAGDVRYLLPVEQDLSQNPCLVLRFQAATFLSFRFVFFCHKAFPCLEIYTLLALTFSSKLRVSATSPEVAIQIVIVIASTVFSDMIQVLGHPDLIADGGVLVHLPVAFVGECAAVCHAVVIHTVFGANVLCTPAVALFGTCRKANCGNS